MALAEKKASKITRKYYMAAKKYAEHIILVIRQSLCATNDAMHTIYKSDTSALV